MRFGNYKLFIKLLFIFLFLFFHLPKILAVPIDPQYILVRKTPQGCFNIAHGTAWDCTYLWNGIYPANYNISAFNEIKNAIGTLGTDYRRLGVGSIFSYLSYQQVHSNAIDLMKQSLQYMLTSAVNSDMAVYIALDGYQWWGGRPDLWNFWDPNKPGYNPANRNNVEWTCWNNSCAINKSWRNWGSEFELEPSPNILSRQFIQANKDGLKELLPIIINWYNSLPVNKKYLLAGIGLTVEADIGANYYYFPNGVWKSGGYPQAVQIGYAAVSTGGIKTSGTITNADITTAVNRYLTEINKYAYEMGVPRNKLFNHTLLEIPGSPFEYENAEASVIEYGQAGWSMYDNRAQNPGNEPLITNSLNMLGKTVWSSPEWLPYPGSNTSQGATQTQWANALRNSLAFRNNLFINVANWDGGIYLDNNAKRAINQVLLETPSCHMNAPVLITPVVNGTTVTFSFKPDLANSNSYWLYASNSPDMTVQGMLKNINVIQEPVTELPDPNTGIISHNRTINYGGSTFYYQVVADGCGSTVRKPSDRGIVSIGPSGDSSGDRKVTGVDYTAWLNNYNKNTGLGPKNGDFHPANNPDAIVDINDFNSWQINYLK